MVPPGTVQAKAWPSEVYTNAFVEQFNAFDVVQVGAPARADRPD